MPYLKKISLILGLLLSFVTIYRADLKAQDDKSVNSRDEAPGQLGATYIARVTSPKAVVYADENMNSPLGFISNGKLITVGNPRKLNRELVPLVVYGRVAFIKISDIRYEDEDDDKFSSKIGAPREHDIDVIIQKPDEKLSQNNSAYFSLHQFYTGDELKNLFMAIDNEEKNSITGITAQFIHRKEFSKFFWGAGFDYSAVSSEHLRFAFFMINPTLGYTLLRNPLFLLDIYGSIDFSVTTAMDIDNNTDREPSGFLFGPQVNARIVFFPEKKYHLVGSMGYRKYKAREIDGLEDVNATPVEGVQNISGVQFAVGLGMEF